MSDGEDYKLRIQVSRFVRARLPDEYRLFRAWELGIPSLVLVGGPQFKTHFILVKEPGEDLSPEESSFANWCLTFNAAAWCCARSVSDAEAALIHWGII